MARRKRDTPTRACTAKTPLPPKRSHHRMEDRACMSHDHLDVPHYYKVPKGTNPPCSCGRVN